MEQSGRHEIGPLRGSLLPMVLAVALVLLLPLAGAAVLGKPLGAYLQFPPKTPDAPHAPFSLPVALGLTLLILAATAPLLLRLASFRRKEGPRKPVMPFPWWGWTGAALLCGFFWETWNFGSTTKWVYAIPYVDALHVFEMPLLGYAGYLPFGVLCAGIGDLVVGFVRKE